MKKNFRKLTGVCILAFATMLFHGACAGENSDDTEQLVLGMALVGNAADLNAAAENLIVKFSGLVIPVEQTRSASRASTLRGSRAAASCVGGVCNGILDCPLGGTWEFFDLRTTSSHNVTGTVTTTSSNSTGRQVARACGQYAARIVNGVIAFDRTAVTDGDVTLRSSTQTSRSDSATGITTSVLDVDFSFIGLSMDGSTPVTGELIYNAENTTTITGKDVDTTVTLSFSGVLQGTPVRNSRTYRYQYKLP